MDGVCRAVDVWGGILNSMLEDKKDGGLMFVLSSSCLSSVAMGARLLTGLLVIVMAGSLGSSSPRFPESGWPRHSVSLGALMMIRRISGFPSFPQTLVPECNVANVICI